MPEAAIPPWMQSNPLAGIPLFLQGYGQGAQAGESQRRGEERAYEAELQQAAQQERNEILREAKQIQAQEFAENLKLKQETAQRAAREAAVQLEGQQGLEKDLQSGMTFQEAFPRWATKILYKHPQSLTQVMRQLQPAKDMMPKEGFVGGRNVIYGAGGGWQFNEPPQTTRVDEGLPPGTYERGNRTFKVLEPKPEKPHLLQMQLDKAQAELAAFKADTGAMAEWNKKQIPAQEARVKYFQEAIRGAAPKTTTETKKQLTIEQAKEFLRQTGGDRDKARQLAKDAGYSF